MSKTKPLRAGIIGLGVGEQHITGYDSHPGCRTTSICDIDKAKLNAVNKRHPHCKATVDPDEILRDPDIDLVSICSFDDAHHDQVITALEHEKHVFVEKPLCVSRAELDNIREAHARRPHLLMSSNLILRRAPRFVDLRERITRGDMGTLFLIEGDYNYGRLWKLTEGWRGKSPDYSVMLGGGVHIIDLMLWLTGDTVVEVSGFGSDLATRNSAYKGHDLRVALLRFGSGMLGKISANFACVYPHHHRFSVYGTAASFENNLDCGLFYTDRNPAVPPQRLEGPYPGVDKYALISGFIDDIRGQGRCDVIAEDVYACMDVCLRVDEAILSDVPL